jgi:hypothetical protein
MEVEISTVSVITCTNNVVLDDALVVVVVNCNNKVYVLYILVEVGTCNNMVKTPRVFGAGAVICNSI